MGIRMGGTEMGLHTIRLYLEPNPDGVYTVTSPDVPGLVTEGQTPDEVQANVQKALDAITRPAGLCPRC